VKHLYDFYRYMRPKNYSDGWHLEQLCWMVERCLVEKKNGIVETPPRHSKSEVINLYAPAWWFLSNPPAHFGLVCNSDSLARKFSAACRGLILSEKYQELAPYRLADDRGNQWKIDTPEQTLDFSYLATGINGQLTGFGFDVLLLDDLLKSGREAKSDTVREGVWDNVASAAINRLSPSGIVIACQARLHHDDTIGKLLATEEGEAE
jgi:hypothetical protein